MLDGDAFECCLLCGDAGGAVALVATCAAHCAVHAHAECFARRRTAAAWRRKHARRSNGDAEVCLVPGCQARLIAPRDEARPKHVAPPRGRDECRDAAAAPPPPSRRAERSPMPRRGGRDGDDETAAVCTFLARDGRPCRRGVVAGTNACRLHAHDADVMRRMVRALEEDDAREAAAQGATNVATRESAAATNVATQTMAPPATRSRATATVREGATATRVATATTQTEESAADARARDELTNLRALNAQDRRRVVVAERRAAELAREVRDLRALLEEAHRALEDERAAARAACAEREDTLAAARVHLREALAAMHA